MRSFFVKLSVFFVVVTINVAIAEGLVRFVNAVYPLERPPELQDKLVYEWIEGKDKPLDGEHRLYTYKPGSAGLTYGHPVRINRYGFRGPEFRPRNSEGGNQGFRILILGDSLTMGQGVAEEERYATLVEAQLRARYTTASIEVVNLGVMGFETVQEEKILVRMWDHVRPDLTVVGFYVNDTIVTYQGIESHRFPMPERLRPYFEQALLFRLAEPWYDRPYRWLRNLPTYDEVQTRARNVESRDWKLFVEKVRKINQRVRDESGQSPFVLFMTHEPGKHDEFYWNVRHTFESNSFIWVEPEITQYRPVSRFEFHPDAVMHQAYADTLSSAIIASQRIPTTASPSR